MKYVISKEMTKDKGLDFLLGSIHFVDRFAFDHKPEHWIGIDVDTIYHRYFEDSISLAKSRLFDGIGHPDLVKLFGHRPSFSLMGYYESLAEELSSSNMYADQNSGVVRRCPLSRRCRLQNSSAGNLHCKCLDKKDSLSGTVSV